MLFQCMPNSNDLLHRQSYPCATHESIWGSGATDISITIQGITWLVILAPRFIFCQDKSPPYSLTRRLSGLQGHSWPFEIEKDFLPPSRTWRPCLRCPASRLFTIVAPVWPLAFPLTPTYTLLIFLVLFSVDLIVIVPDFPDSKYVMYSLGVSYFKKSSKQAPCEIFCILRWAHFTPSPIPRAEGPTFSTLCDRPCVCLHPVSVSPYCRQHLEDKMVTRNSLLYLACTSGCQLDELWEPLSRVKQVLS
jgi:hypothetical protein